MDRAPPLVVVVGRVVRRAHPPRASGQTVLAPPPGRSRPALGRDRVGLLGLVGGVPQDPAEDQPTGQDVGRTTKQRNDFGQPRRQARQQLDVLPPGDDAAVGRDRDVPRSRPTPPTTLPSWTIRTRPTPSRSSRRSPGHDAHQVVEAERPEAGARPTKVDADAVAAALVDPHRPSVAPTRRAAASRRSGPTGRRPGARTSRVTENVLIGDPQPAGGRVGSSVGAEATASGLRRRAARAARGSPRRARPSSRPSRSSTSSTSSIR